MLTFFTQYITFQNQSLSFVWKNQVLFVVKTTLDNWTTSENRVNLNYFVQSWYCSVIFLNLKPRNWSQFHCCQTNQFVSLISVPEGSKCCNGEGTSQGFLDISSGSNCLFSFVQWWILRYWWAGYSVLFNQRVNRIIRIFIMWISWNLCGPHLDNHFVSWDTTDLLHPPWVWSQYQRCPDIVWFKSENNIPGYLLTWSK